MFTVVAHQVSGVASAIEALRGLNPDVWAGNPCSILFDFTNEQFVPSPFQAVAIASASVSLFQNSRIALVFVRPVRYEAGEIAAALLTASERLRIFSHVRNAEEWLMEKESKTEFRINGDKGDQV